jgi:DNA-directed RNA polymerase subunit K/omega
MDEGSEFLEDVGEAGEAVAGEEEADREPAPPIESRFLYVDVAAQRAKQLRRGALPKLEEMADDSGADGPVKRGRKLERIAMREVDRGKIYYDVPSSARGE